YRSSEESPERKATRAVRECQFDTPPDGAELDSRGIRPPAAAFRRSERSKRAGDSGIPRAISTRVHPEPESETHGTEPPLPRRPSYPLSPPRGRDPRGRRGDAPRAGAGPGLLRRG